MSKEGKKESAGTEQKAGQQKKDYIGCVMSLISKQEIRYVGTLVMINSQDQTLVLQNVKSYGSEGRRGGSNEEVPASQETYQHIIFRASELKDFYVIKSPEKDFEDPAILSTEAKKKEQKKDYPIHTATAVKPPTQEAPPAQASIPAPAPATAPTQAPVQTHPNPQISAGSAAAPQEEGKSKSQISASTSYGYENQYEYQQRYTRIRSRRSYQPRYSPGGQRGSPKKTDGVFKESSNEALKDEYQEDYDFEGMNKKFQTLFTENQPAVDVAVGYDKGKSFYDSISRNTDEKKETNFDREQQKQINAETFNLDYNSQKDRRRGGEYNPRYRGEGRGYRRRGGYTQRRPYNNQRGVRYYKKTNA